MKSVRLLNNSQATLVKHSWPTIVTNDFWTLFYMNLFQRNPSYQSYFERFADVPYEHLRSNVHFTAHTSRTGFAFSAAIELLETPEELRRILEDLGEKHCKFRLTAKHFQTVGDVLTDLIESRLNNVPPTRERADLTVAWKLCVTTIIGVIEDAAVSSGDDRS